jgi:hypothetical protein
MLTVVKRRAEATRGRRIPMTGGWPGTARFGDANLGNGNKIQPEECLGSYLTTRRSQAEVDSRRRGGGAMVTTAAVPTELGGSLRVST